MERLSDKAIEIINDLHTERLDYTSEYLPLIEAAQKLSSYEDTDLEPEQVTELMAAHGTAILEISEYRQLGPKKHLQELAQAEKDGRLVEYMPGDKVYDRFGTPWIVESSEIHLIGAEIKHLYRCGNPGTEDYCALYEEEIRTREEAEAALKKREEVDDEID